MKQLTLTAELAEKIGNTLQEAGYSVSEKQQYMRYFKAHGDSTYISHSFNIIRSFKNTDGQQIVANMFGEANGKASECHDDNYDSWYFNGYTGKAGSKVY